MTLCRKCGKEIPDGEELCEDCQNEDMDLDEAYLDELIQNMELSSGSDEEAPEEDSIMDALSFGDDLPEEIFEDEPAASDKTEEEEEPVVLNDSTEEEEPELALEDAILEEEPELALEDAVLEEEPELALEDAVLEEEPELALEDVAEEEEPELALDDVTAEEEPELVLEDAAAEPDSEDDINHLLDMLSDDYEETGEADKSAESEEADDIPEEAPVSLEASLFQDEDETDHLFADSLEEEESRKDNGGATMDEVFQDALSVVGYSEKETEEEDAVALGDLDASDKVTEIPLKTPEKRMKKPKSGVSFWKKIFGNIITDETAELEAKERAAELEGEEEKAKLKEEKKQQAEAAKAEKAELQKAEKDKKAAAKAEQSAAKAAAKEEKKRLKMEREANEVVGKINPVGATIVMVFFGIICLFIIFGTQIFSYSHAVNKADSNFKAGDYADAYQSLAGVNVSESSKEIEDKVRICMQLQKKVESHDNYFKMKLYLEALDSLVKGVRCYDANKEKADNYGILNQFNALEGQITSLLYSEYGVSETQARSIIDSDSQEEYTDKLEAIIRQWSEKMKEDER